MHAQPPYAERYDQHGAVLAHWDKPSADLPFLIGVKDCPIYRRGGKDLFGGP
ncbi:MAG: hypothetical protein ABWK05_04960 [Pyrobaculum sp.]